VKGTIYNLLFYELPVDEEEPQSHLKNEIVSNTGEEINLHCYSPEGPL
jgi:hypothetical protein